MTDTVSEIEISFEVWQDGDMVAAADNLSDAQHFMLVYAQDGPVEAKTAITTRFLGFNVVTPMLAASPQEAAPTKREAALADLAKLDGETMDLAASPQGEGSSADADTHRAAEGAVVARERDEAVRLLRRIVETKHEDYDGRLEAGYIKAFLASLSHPAAPPAEPVLKYELHPTGSGGSSDVLTYRVTEGVKP